MVRVFDFSAIAASALLAIIAPVVTFSQPVRGSIAEQARAAKARGERTIHLDTPIPLPIAMRTADDATSKLSALLVTKTASLVTMSGGNSNEIITWYKFRIDEVLSRQTGAVDSSPLPPDVPESLLPLKADEILVPEPGGSVTVEDVTVTMDGDDLASARDSDKYVVFGLLSSSGKVLQTIAGRSLIYSVAADDTLTSLAPLPSPISREIARRGRNSLHGLRATLVNQR